MPELPEVETIVREMHESRLIGCQIEKAVVFSDRSILHQTSHSFCQKMAHQTIVDIKRRGKFIVFILSQDMLLVHLRMTGKFIIDKKNAKISSHERVRLYLSDQRILRYEDQRKFGKWSLIDSEKILSKLGKEPLSKEFTLAVFKAYIEKSRRQIKPFLLDQHIITGIGNIYADEALFEAKIHPSRSTQSLSDNEIRSLHQAIILVLRKGIANTGTSLGSARANYYSINGHRGKNQTQLKVFRQNGSPCPRCQTIIKKMKIAQRGTHFCPSCQKMD